ncbi:RNase H family protein [Nocardioides sp. P5_E3]
MAERIALSLNPDFASGRWAWSLMGESFGSTGSVRAHGREDAVVCALAAAYPALQRAVPVEVVVSLPPTAQLWSCAAEVSALFAGVTLMPYTETDSTLRSAAMRALNPSPPFVAPPADALTVATDGSATRGRIGWGWLAEDGRHGHGTEAPSTRLCVRRKHPVLAELRAISEAITALPHRDLVIRTDCRPAISLVEEWMGGGDRVPDGYVATHHTAVKRGGLLWMQEQVRTQAPRLDIGWVRGHAGDPLNEGADSLAKLARRAAEGTWGFTAADVPQRAREIAGAFTTAHQTTQSPTAA